MAEPALKCVPFTAPANARAETLKPNILIVDDRRENLLATEKILKNLRANIFKASSGNEALSLMLRHKFAVVLLDVQMPEMDGFETAALMQEHESMMGTPIIFVTAISKEERYATQAAEIGAVDYIFKPINSEILRSKVHVYLDLYMQREQILKLNAGLRQSNEELERFAYMCAHDLKSPLRAIDSLSQWIEEDQGESLSKKSRTYMDTLHKRVRRMERLLDDILEYSRIDPKIEPTSSDIINGKTLMDDIIALIEPPKNFTVRVSGAFEKINLHRMPLQQVIYNLMNNAIKHHDKEFGNIDVNVETDENCYTFSIQDDGPGIDPQYHGKVFEMFQTLKPRDSKEGSGIGLAFVKKIVTGLGGTVSLESAAGAGALFRFSWPK